MKHTRVASILGLVVLGAVIGFLLEVSTAAAGRAVLIPPLSLPITLVVVAGIVIGFAIPIKRATSGTSRIPVNPFRAMRIVVLAKACTLSGALMVGSGLGIAVFLLSRSVLPPTGTLWLAGGTVLGSIVLLVGGVVAERLCTLPPDDDASAVR